MNEKVRVKERNSEINIFNNCIKEIELQLKNGLNKELEKELKNYRQKVVDYRLDIIEYYIEKKDDDFTDVWESSELRNEIFKEFRDWYRNVDKRKYVIQKDEQWINIFAFYDYFLQHEIFDLYYSIQPFDLINKKMPNPVLKRDEIVNLDAYLKEVNRNISNYIYDETKNYYSAIKSYKISFKELEEKLKELYAHLLFEENQYDAALSAYNELAEEHSKIDLNYHSYICKRKGDIYCAKLQYDLALKEYDLALQPFDSDEHAINMSLSDKENLKKRRGQIAAILEQ